MLVLGRKIDEYVTIIHRPSGQSFQVGIAEIRGCVVRMGIDDRFNNFEVIRNELLAEDDPRRLENNPLNPPVDPA